MRWCTTSNSASSSVSTVRELQHDGTIAWRSLLDEATERLAAVAVAPASEARWIVQEAAGHEGAEVVSGLDEPATNRGMARFDAMIARRLDGEPLQYVLGRWGFRTLDLLVDRRVLIPRSETETVVEVALGVLDELARPSDESVVVDLGTGSGAIALSVAVERPGTQVWATDVSDEALRVARANLAGIGRRGTQVTMGLGSWFEALPDSLVGSIDLIITNPPYIAADEDLPAEVRDWEPELALVAGARGVEAYEHLVATAPRWLRSDGALVAELAPHQREVVSGLAAEHFDDVRIERDLAERERVLVARRPR